MTAGGHAASLALVSSALTSASCTQAPPPPCARGGQAEAAQSRSDPGRAGRPTRLVNQMGRQCLIDKRGQLQKLVAGCTCQPMPVNNAICRAFHKRSCRGRRAAIVHLVARPSLQQRRRAPAAEGASDARVPAIRHSRRAGQWRAARTPVGQGLVGRDEAPRSSARPRWRARRAQRLVVDRTPAPALAQRRHLCRQPACAC